MSSALGGVPSLDDGPCRCCRCIHGFCILQRVRIFATTRHNRSQREIPSWGLADSGSWRCEVFSGYLEMVPFGQSNENFRLRSNLGLGLIGCNDGVELRAVTWCCPQEAPDKKILLTTLDRHTEKNHEEHQNLDALTTTSEVRRCICLIAFVFVFRPSTNTHTQTHTNKQSLGHDEHQS